MNEKEINYTPEQNTYPVLTPFKGWVLTNFPFIEKDFDSLTIYGMICKVTEYLNKIINNQNLVETDMSKMYEAYDKLQTYVNNYFDSLDVQNEINNKLDEMAQSGELDIIFNNYTKPTIFIGDSYGIVTDNYDNPWPIGLANKLNLVMNTNAWNFSRSGSGFTTTYSFLYQLQNNENLIPDKLQIRNIIVCGGYNDRYNPEDINEAISKFVSYCKTNYPNARVYIGMIGYTSRPNNIEPSGNISNIRDVITNKILYYYKNCVNYGAIYLNNVEYIMHNYALFSDDYVHPSSLGQTFLSNNIYQALVSGSTNIIYPLRNLNFGTFSLYFQQQNNLLNSRISGNLTLSELIDTKDNITSFDLGVPTNNLAVRYVNAFSYINGTALIQFDDNTIEAFNIRITPLPDENGSFSISIFGTKKGKKIKIVVFQNIDNLLNPLSF